MAVLLFLTGLLCIVSLFFFTKSTTEQIIATEKDVDTVTEQITAKQKEFQTAQEKYTAAVDEVQNNINYLKQKAQTASQKQEKEKADISEEETTSKPSVFSQADASEPDNFSADNGHVVGIDPGHQGENVDMSAPEPIGPGSSEMKAKCTSGTRGSFTGIPEYQLNLNVSLQLKDVLEQRGYRVVMTRTDNDTAISNKERAEYAASQGQRSMSVFTQTVRILLLHPEPWLWLLLRAILMFPLFLISQTDFPSVFWIPIVRLQAFRIWGYSTQIL